MLVGEGSNRLCKLREQWQEKFKQVQQQSQQTVESSSHQPPGSFDTQSTVA